MATSAQDIVDAIDALMLAKLQGVSDLKELAERKLGEFSIKWDGSLRELRELRAYYLAQVAAESGGGEERIVML